MEGLNGKAEPFRTGGRQSRGNNIKENLVMASSNLLLAHYLHQISETQLLSRYHTKERCGCARSLASHPGERARRAGADCAPNSTAREIVKERIENRHRKKR